MRITFLRHAESIFNANPKNTDLDCSLTLNGLEQAKQLRGHYSLVLVSPLLRAQLTLAASRITADEVWIWSGAREQRTDLCDFLPGEESERKEDEDELMSRTDDFLYDIQSIFGWKHSHILVVSHCEFIHTLTGQSPKNGTMVHLDLSPMKGQTHTSSSDTSRGAPAISPAAVFSSSSFEPPAKRAKLTPEPEPELPQNMANACDLNTISVIFSFLNKPNFSRVACVSKLWYQACCLRSAWPTHSIPFTSPMNGLSLDGFDMLRDKKLSRRCLTVPIRSLSKFVTSRVWSRAPYVHVDGYLMHEPFDAPKPFALLAPLQLKGLDIFVGDDVGKLFESFPYDSPLVARLSHLKLGVVNDPESPVDNVIATFSRFRLLRSLMLNCDLSAESLDGCVLLESLSLHLERGILRNDTASMVCTLSVKHSLRRFSYIRGHIRAKEAPPCDDLLRSLTFYEDNSMSDFSLCTCAGLEELTIVQHILTATDVEILSQMDSLRMLRFSTKSLVPLDFSNESTTMRLFKRLTHLDLHLLTSSSLNPIQYAPNLEILRLRSVASTFALEVILAACPILHTLCVAVDNWLAVSDKTLASLGLKEEEKSSAAASSASNTASSDTSTSTVPNHTLVNMRIHSHIIPPRGNLAALGSALGLRSLTLGREFFGPSQNWGGLLSFQQLTQLSITQIGITIGTLPSILCVLPLFRRLDLYQCTSSYQTELPHGLLQSVLTCRSWCEFHIHATERFKGVKVLGLESIELPQSQSIQFDWKRVKRFQLISHRLTDSYEQNPLRFRVDRTTHNGQSIIKWKLRTNS